MNFAKIARRTALLVLVAGGLAACNTTTSSVPVSTSAPTIASGPTCALGQVGGRPTALGLVLGEPWDDKDGYDVTYNGQAGHVWDLVNYRVMPGSTLEVNGRHVLVCDAFPEG